MPGLHSASHSSLPFFIFFFNLSCCLPNSHPQRAWFARDKCSWVLLKTCPLSTYYWEFDSAFATWNIQLFLPITVELLLLQCCSIQQYTSPENDLSPGLMNFIFSLIICRSWNIKHLLLKVFYFFLFFKIYFVESEQMREIQALSP